nr:hypothetical protein Iba_chr09dCG1340 [Ipomoea batatas]
MDLCLANPCPSTAQILGRGVPPQERRHSTKLLELPDVQEVNCHKQCLYGSVVSASIPPVKVSNQMRDEHHFLFFEHKHMKALCQAMQLTLPQPLRKNGKCCSCLGSAISSSRPQTILHRLSPPFSPHHTVVFRRHTRLSKSPAIEAMRTVQIAADRIADANSSEVNSTINPRLLPFQFNSPEIAPLCIRVVASSPS